MGIQTRQQTCQYLRDALLRSPQCLKPWNLHLVPWGSDDGKQWETTAEECTLMQIAAAKNSLENTLYTLYGKTSKIKNTNITSIPEFLSTKTY